MQKPNRTMLTFCIKNLPEAQSQFQTKDAIKQASGMRHRDTLAFCLQHPRMLVLLALSKDSH